MFIILLEMHTSLKYLKVMCGHGNPAEQIKIPHDYIKLFIFKRKL